LLAIEVSLAELGAVTRLVALGWYQQAVAARHADLIVVPGIALPWR
jgi:hypothetical protein